MISTVSGWASKLRSRGHLYGEVLAWIGVLGWRESRGAISLSILTALLSVALQSGTAMMVVGSLRQALTFGHVQHFPWIDRIGVNWTDPSELSVVLVVTTLVALAGVARFVSRHLGIEVEGRIHTRLTCRLLDAATRPMSLFEAYQRRRSFNMASVQRAMFFDSRLCGSAVRIFLYNVMHVAQLAVGLAMLLFIAPVLVVAVAALLILGFLLVYPLNIRAVQISRDLERLAAERGSGIRENLKGILQFPANSRSQPAGEAMLGPAFTSHLRLWNSRMRIIELSRLTMAFVLAVALGLFVWFGMPSAGATQHTNVLAAFVGFYFSLIGMQGLAVTATTINRFLPNILRVYRVQQALMPQGPGGDATAIGGADGGGLGGITKVPWRIENGCGIASAGPQSGAFTAGNVYGLLMREPDVLAAMFQLIDTVRAVKRPFAAACEDYLHLMKESEDRAPDAETLDWIVNVMAAAKLRSDPQSVRDLLAVRVDADPKMSALAHYLNGIATVRRLPTPLAFIDGNQLVDLGYPGADLVCEALREKIAFFNTSKLELALLCSPTNELFISDGSNIRCALLLDGLTEAAKDQVRNLFWGRAPDGDASVVACSRDAGLTAADAELL